MKKIYSLARFKNKQRNKANIMAEYLGDYKNSMDREYFEPMTDADKPIIPMGEVGISANPTIDQLQALKSRIFQGVSKVELGFFGRGKGSMQGGNTTPEMYGTEQRKAIRELAEINRVELTTHASVAHGTMSGMTEQGFSDEARRASITEIQRAVDFAADVARGGPVVVHTGEWQRPISEAGGNGGKFSGYDFTAFGGDNEKDKGAIYLADSETGKIMGFRKDMKVFRPIVEEEKDSFDKTKKIPLYKLNKDSGEIEVEEVTYKSFLEKLNEDKKKHYSDNEKEKKYWIDQNTGKEKTPEIMFYETFLKTKKDQYHGESLRYLDHLETYRKQLDSMKKEYELQVEIEKATPDEYKYQHENETKWGERIKKSEEMRKNITNVEREIQQIQEHSSSYAANAREVQENIDNLRPIEEVGIKKTAETIAKAASYAYDKELSMNLSKPLFIAPENVFPEQYGAHPQELKKIVKESRAAMTKYIMDNQSKYKVKSKEDAEKIAETHIKATFDIGHANTWKKYFNEKKEGDFNKWLMNEVDDLIKNKIIGHVHISDNFGYEDEHVTPGEGSAPIKEFIERIKKDKTIGINVESAHQDVESLLGAWRLFGSPVNGLSGSRTDRWTNLEGGYFGKTKSPYFVFGEYAPSDDFRGSPFWTGLPLE